jgi:glycine hydroxymethyltransferase
MVRGAAGNYFSRFEGGAPDRLREILDLQAGIIGRSIHLIASACYPFTSVLEALGQPSFVLPVEGERGARFLPGSVAMDRVEAEGEILALQLFGSPEGYGASLQPHSGTQANQIVYNAVLKPDDKVLCLRPRDGGHISHTVLIARRHESHNYGLTSDGLIDYDRLRDLALQIRPKLIIVGGSALPRQIDFERCGQIATQAGALLHADISHTATFVAAGLHASAFPSCDFVTFNTVKNLRGPNGGMLLFREDYRAAIAASTFPTTQGGPNESNMLGKFASLLEWQRRDIRHYAASIVTLGQVVAETLQEHGLTVTTGGTDCHIVLLELRNGAATGAELEGRFQSFDVLLNRNLIPADPRGPAVTSGLRIGVTNLAILGYTPEDAGALAGWIAQEVRGERPSADFLVYLKQRYRWSLGAEDVQ